MAPLLGRHTPCESWFAKDAVSSRHGQPNGGLRSSPWTATPVSVMEVTIVDGRIVAIDLLGDPERRATLNHTALGIRPVRADQLVSSGRPRPAATKTASRATERLTTRATRSSPSEV